MSNNCTTSNVKPVRISELASYASLKSDDIIQIVQSSSGFFSRKVAFSDFVQSITQLTSSLSGNVKGNFIGNLTGNVNGSVTGNLNGNLINGVISNSTGSIKGIPFTKLNNHDISFQGKSSYSVSGSYVSSSNLSLNSLNSVYALSSSLAFTTNTLSSSNSSYSITSSYSETSLFSTSSSLSNTSKKSIFSDYAEEIDFIDSSSYTDTAYLNLSSSYAESANFSKLSSFSNTSVTSSYSKVSNYSLKTVPANFDMVYFTTFNEGDSTYFNNRMLLIDQKNKTTNWKKVLLTSSYACINETQGVSPLPPNVKFVYLTFRFSISDDSSGREPIMLYSPDPYNPAAPLIYIDLGRTWVNGGNVNLLYTHSQILPIKPGPTGSFYFKVASQNTIVAYETCKIYLLGYIKPQDCGS